MMVLDSIEVSLTLLLALCPEPRARALAARALCRPREVPPSAALRLAGDGPLACAPGAARAARGRRAPRARDLPPPRDEPRTRRTAPPSSCRRITPSAP